MGHIVLDDIDCAIINLLQQDVRISAVKIAERLPGVTPRIVRYRIDRLVKEQVIAITAVLNPKVLGYDVIADVLIECEPGKIPSIIDRLIVLERVTYVGAVTGEQDISISIVARSAEELYEYVLKQVAKISGVRRMRTYLVPRVLKGLHEWKLPQECISSHQLDEPR